MHAEALNRQQNTIRAFAFNQPERPDTMRYVIDVKNGKNRILEVCSNAYSSTRATIKLQASRERARSAYAAVKRDIPTHFDYRLATVESAVFRCKGDTLLNFEFTVITSESAL